MSAGTYVYGVLRDGVSLSLPPGIDGLEPRLLHADGLAAVVGGVRRLPVRPSRRNLEAHTDVLAAAMDGGTVLPMRFGIVLPRDRAVVDDLLGGARVTLGRLLDALAGKVELELKVAFDEVARLREILGDRDDLRRLRERVQSRPAAAAYYDKLRLGEAIAAELDRRRRADEQRLLNALAPLAADVQVRDQLPDSVLTKTSFLVERDRVARFERAVDELACDAPPHLRFLLYGPMPPYSFSDVRLPVGASA